METPSEEIGCELKKGGQEPYPLRGGHDVAGAEVVAGENAPRLGRLAIGMCMHGGSPAEPL